MISAIATTESLPIQGKSLFTSACYVVLVFQRPFASFRLVKGDLL